MIFEWLNRKEQVVSTNSSYQDFKSEIKLQGVLNRSKAFNIQMVIFTMVPALYFWIAEDSFMFDSIYGKLGCLTLLWLVPGIYGLSLAFDSLHAMVVFRVAFRMLSIFGVGLWKLLLATLIWKDYVVQSTVMTIGHKWSLWQKLDYINKYLSFVDGGSLIKEATRKEVADSCTTLQQIVGRLNDVLYSTLNPSFTDKLTLAIDKNIWPLLCFVGFALVLKWCVGNFDSVFDSRKADLKRIQALESQLQAVMDKTRDVGPSITCCGKRLQLQSANDGSSTKFLWCSSDDNFTWRSKLGFNSFRNDLRSQSEQQHD